MDQSTSVLHVSYMEGRKFWVQMRYTGGEENRNSWENQSKKLPYKIITIASGAMSSVAQAELEIAKLGLYHSSVKIIVPWPG